MWLNHEEYELEGWWEVYYLLQIAYSLEAFLYLLSYSVNLTNLTFQDSKRGDFREMFIHHLTTNLLTLLSYSFNFTRVGTYILYLHDFSDVPIDISKMFNFLKLKIPTAIGFSLIVVCWIYARMYVFGFYVIWSVIFDTPHSEFTSITSGSELYYNTYKSIFVVALTILYLLHCYWLKLFFRMGILLVRKFETHDLSEHKDGEEYEYIRGRANSLSEYDLQRLDEDSDIAMKIKDAECYYGNKIAKYFDGTAFKGFVKSGGYEVSVGWWQIVFDDGDIEDWDEKEIQAGRQLYKDVYLDENGERNEVLTPPRRQNISQSGAGRGRVKID